LLFRLLLFLLLCMANNNNLSIIVSIFVIFCTISNIVKQVECEEVDGTIHPNSNWVFIAKFCFDTHGGTLSITVDWDPSMRGQEILLYSDIEKEWPAVYHSKDGCQSKADKAATFLSPNNTASGSTAQFSVAGVRPRWWYIAASNCGQASLGDLTYHMVFLNDGGKWTKQFSTDEQGIYQASIAFIVFYLAILCIFIRSYIILKRKDLQSRIMMYLIIIISIEILTLVFEVFHYYVYSTNGKGVPALLVLANIVDIPHQVLFMGLILLISKGWTISTMHVTPRRLLNMTLFLLAIAYVALFLWGTLGVDPASVLYIYESPPGYIIIALRILILFYFAFNIRKSYMCESRHQKTKKLFYFIFGVGYSVWFIAMPLTVLIAHFSESWVRQRTVTILTLCIDCCSYLGFAWLFRPFRSNKFVAILDPMITFGTNTLQVYPEYYK